MAIIFFERSLVVHFLFSPNVGRSMYRYIVITMSTVIVLLLGGTFISMVRERAQSEVSLSSIPTESVGTTIVETLEPTVQIETDDMQTGGEIPPKALNTLFLPLIMMMCRNL